MNQDPEQSELDIDDEEILDYEFLHAIAIAIVGVCVLVGIAVPAIYFLT